MAGGQGVRRLRSRDIPVLPHPQPIPIVNMGENVVRQTKAGGSKRAAMEAHGATANSSSLHANKKRAAFTNLTNLTNSANSTLVSQSSSYVKVPAPAKKSSSVAHPDSSSVSIITDNKSEEESSHKAESICVPPAPIKEASGSLLNPKAVDKYATTECESESALIPSLHQIPSSILDSDPKGDGEQGEEEGCLVDVEGQGWSAKTYTDIDIHKDPQMCSTYAAEIYHHLRMAELKRRPVPDFMESAQQDINASMRGILVDWLVEVAEEYKLVPDTLYLTVSYIDRFLSSNPISRQRLQLIGVTCMLVASKYEEICPPQVEEFCYITDNTYGKEEVLEMERRILKYLHFEIAGPTTKSFLRRFIQTAKAGHKATSLQVEFLGNYLAELTLVEYHFLHYLPSMIASAAVFLAKLTIDPSTKPWDKTLQHYTGYRPSELKECVKAIHDLQRNVKNCTLPAIREKYRQHKFKCVATYPSPQSLPPHFFEDS